VQIYRTAQIAAIHALANIQEALANIGGVVEAEVVAKCHLL
jgi:hypothetical protein